MTKMGEPYMRNEARAAPPPPPPPPPPYVYRRDVSEWQGFKWLLPIIALASLAIGIFVFTDDERDLTMEEQLATQGVVMDIQTFTPVQSIMVTVTPSYDTD